jgi:hypothetical protein
MTIAVLVSMVLPFFSGCAAMFHGTTQQVSIRSNTPDTELYVNETYLGKGDTITALRKNKDYSITARKNGCHPTTVPVLKTFDPLTLLGILLDWGLFSVLIIDGVATGAWQQFDQTSYVVDPLCSAPRIF